MEVADETSPQSLGLDRKTNVLAKILERNKVNGIFNENTKVERNLEGFNIQSKLLDGIEEGGQLIEIKTSLPEKVDKLGIDVDALEVLELHINGGINIADRFDKLFLEMRPLVFGRGETFSSLELKVFEQHHPLRVAAAHQKGTMAVKKEKIFITSFKDGDDLAILFHEQGHCSDKLELTDEQIANVIYFGTVYNKERQTVIDREKAISGWKEVVLMESRANSNALSLLSRISVSEDIFSNDKESGFMRFRKSRETSLVTYINMSGGWYKEQIPFEELQKFSSI